MCNVVFSNVLSKAAICKALFVKKKRFPVINHTGSIFPVSISIHLSNTMENISANIFCYLIN